MKTINVCVKTRLSCWAKMIYELLKPKQKWLTPKNLGGKKLYLFEYACRRLPNY
ncbi:hypothetical protein [Flavobacterium araucananum]|uniref:hypothetical protein n=1 Tax=Flavobacterium araucananum TaxID=946678 RepID=UPI0013FE4DB3|nr:hypothetical protein [Flavobacterium araucananum]